MDIEFHYYITYILARKSGYTSSDASTIAYACQYTDDNNDIYKVNLSGGRSYENFISQTLDIFHPKNKKNHIYTCFHFLSGDFASEQTSRTDGTQHIFNTTPNSENAKKMFNAALNSGDIYRIGIAAHCYADTWAHQNFVGFKNGFNRQKGILQRLLRIPVMMLVPCIGHAEFQEQPDIPNLRWVDRRLAGPQRVISNKQRFLAACEVLFTCFAERNGLDDIKQRWTTLAAELDNSIGDESESVAKARGKKAKRISAYRTICPDMPQYDDKQWLLEAAVPMVSKFVKRCDALWQLAGGLMIWGFDLGSIIKAHWPKSLRTRTFAAKAGFYQTRWYAFQEAVKTHQTLVLKLLRDRYQQIGPSGEKVLRMLQESEPEGNYQKFVIMASAKIDAFVTLTRRCTRYITANLPTQILSWRGKKVQRAVQ